MANNKQAKVKLTPPDRKQCQAMKPNGNTFMTLGGVPGRVRCRKPAWCIIYELKPNPKDGQKGSMSLCKECLQVFYQQEGSTKVRMEQIVKPKTKRSESHRKS